MTATFFEITTMIAMMYFRTQGVDFAVFEVGIGGKLDATNIVSPEICAITSIGLDHTESLGNTIDEIAVHKAGIIKPNTKLVVGIDAPHKVFKPIADSMNAPYCVVVNHDQTFKVQNEQIAKSVVQKVLEKLKMEDRIEDAMNKIEQVD